MKTNRVVKECCGIIFTCMCLVDVKTRQTKFKTIVTWCLANTQLHICGVGYIDGWYMQLPHILYYNISYHCNRGRGRVVWPMKELHLHVHVHVCNCMYTWYLSHNSNIMLQYMVWVHMYVGIHVIGICKQSTCMSMHSMHLECLVEGFLQ